MALDLREAFEHLGLRGVPEDIGLEGHAGLPAVEHDGATYADTREFSAGWRNCSSGGTLSGWSRDMARPSVAGKVFVDWSQNDRHKTTVNVYSLRAMERPTVSTPLTWDEVEDVAESG